MRELISAASGRARVFRQCFRRGACSQRALALQMRPELADARHHAALLIEVLLQHRQARFDAGFILLDLLQPFAVIRAHGGFAPENALLHQQIVQLAHGLLDGRGRSVMTQGQPGAGRVENAHRLIRQLAPHHVAMRKTHRRLHRFLENPDAMVFFERRNHAAQHHHAAQLFRFIHLYHLKAPRQSGVLLEIFLVLRPGGGRDGAQLAASQGGFQKIGRVALPFRATRSDHGVRFVDEQNNRRGRIFYFFNQPFQPVFKFALHAGAGL